MGYCVLKTAGVLGRDSCWRGARGLPARTGSCSGPGQHRQQLAMSAQGALVGALAFTPLFKIPGLWLGPKMREKPSLKLEAWSLSKATYDNPVVLSFGARGNARLSSEAGTFFFLISTSEINLPQWDIRVLSSATKQESDVAGRRGYSKHTQSLQAVCCQSCDPVKTHRKSVSRCRVQL